MRSALAAVLAAVLLAALPVVGQEPKPKDPAKKPADPVPDTPKPAAGAPGEFDEPAFKSADGVKLNGKFYAGKPGGSVVMLLNSATDVSAPSAWTGLIGRLTARGYNVLQFDYRGFGKNNEIVPSEFWLNNVNQTQISGSTANRVTQGTIDRKKFRPGYLPMFVQDIAAARSVLDQMNDNGTVNASTIYVIGTGDAASLGLFFLATEWLREARKPNLAVPPQVVSPRRNLFGSSEPAGRDYGGAVWLSPAKLASLPVGFLKDVVLSPASIEMRTETPMLFIHGAKDKKSAPVAKSLANEVLAAGTGTGGKFQKAAQIFVVPIPDTDAAGTALLDNNLATFGKIEAFLTQMDADRKSRIRKPREWDRPLIIDVQAFGLGR